MPVFFMNIPVRSLVLLVFVCAVCPAFGQPAMRESGIGLYKKGDHQGAITTLKKVTRSESWDAEAWYYLGMAYRGANKQKDAKKALERATKLDPRNDQFHVSLAALYLSWRDRRAMAEANAALAVNPGNYVAHYIVGVQSLNDQFYSHAYERAKLAIGINPAYAPPYLLKSEALVSSFPFQTGSVVKPPRAKSDLLNEASEALEKYLELSDDSATEKEFHTWYLESLRFFAGYYNRAENRSYDVTGIGYRADGSRTPIRIISNSKPNYTDYARSNVIEGTVRVLAGFSSTGRVEHAIVVRPLDRGLDKEAVAAARKIKFVPATKDGVPVTTVKLIEYTFSIY